MVYNYGTVPVRVAPVRGEEQALSQLGLAKRLWNVLVTIERFRVAAYRRIMHDEAQEEIGRLRQRRAAVWAEIRALRKQARAKIATPSELEADLVRVKAALAMLLDHQRRPKTSGILHGAHSSMP